MSGGVESAEPTLVKVQKPESRKLSIGSKINSCATSKTPRAEVQQDLIIGGFVSY